MRAQDTADEHTVNQHARCELQTSAWRHTTSHAHHTDATSEKTSCKTIAPAPPVPRPYFTRVQYPLQTFSATRQSVGEHAKPRQIIRCGSRPQAGQHAGRGDVDAAVGRHRRDLAAGAERLARDDDRLAEDCRAWVHAQYFVSVCSHFAGYCSGVCGATAGTCTLTCHILIERADHTSVYIVRRQQTDMRVSTYCLQGPYLQRKIGGTAS